MNQCWGEVRKGSAPEGGGHGPKLPELRERWDTQTLGLGAQSRAKGWT